MAQHLDYTTMAGDAYDILALDFYNDEFMAHIIAEANPRYAGVLQFNAGVQLVIPIVEEVHTAETLPPWRR